MILRHVLNRDYIGNSREAAEARRDMLRHPDWAKKLQLVAVGEAHAGCVNAVRWDDDGSRLVSGSDDRKVRCPGREPKWVKMHALAR